MNLYQFAISMAWVLVALIVVGFGLYLVLSGRLRWVEYNSVVGKVGMQVTTTLGIKDLSPDEILAFESFVYRDLSHLERGARLAYVLLFMERQLIEAQFTNKHLEIELTEKGKQLHTTIMAECEKRLMITPKTEIVWKTGEKRIVKEVEDSHTKR